MSDAYTDAPAERAGYRWVKAVHGDVPPWVQWFEAGAKVPGAVTSAVMSAERAHALEQVHALLGQWLDARRAGQALPGDVEILLSAQDAWRDLRTSCARVNELT